MKTKMKLSSQIMIALGLALSFASTSAVAEMKAAKNRYLVIYKSEQGHRAMESFMQLEANSAYGLTNSLKHINGMVIQTPNQRVIDQLKNLRIRPSLNCVQFIMQHARVSIGVSAR